MGTFRFKELGGQRRVVDHAVDRVSTHKIKKRYASIIDKLRPIDCDCDGVIERVSMFHADRGLIALVLLTDKGTLTMQLTRDALRRIAALAVKVADGGKGHLDVT